jgi:hypothetical protein
MLWLSTYQTEPVELSVTLTQSAAKVETGAASNIKPRKALCSEFFIMPPG